MTALVTVKGRFEHSNNAPAGPGELTWTLIPGDVPDITEPVTVVTGPVTVPIDKTGAFTVTLRGTDDPALMAAVDGDLVYEVKRRYRGVVDSWFVTVPVPGPWDWAQLSPMPAGAAAGVVTPVPGPVGPIGPTGLTGPVGNAYPTVPLVANLPAAAANAGKAYWVTATSTIVVSDGTRWRTVYGDTGWRSLGAAETLDPNWVLDAEIRRVNHVVQMTGQATCLTAGQSMTAAWIEVYAILPGFRLSTMNGLTVTGARLSAGNYPHYLSLAVTGANSIGFLGMNGLAGKPNAYAVTDRVDLVQTWMTQDGWPTVLPGTAIGAIP